MANVRVLVVLSVIVLSSTVFSVHAAIKSHSDADKEETLEELVEKLRSYVHKHEHEAENAESSEVRTTTRGSGMTQEMKDKVMVLHNNYHKNEGAANMQKMVYNEKLASLAQDWADRCNVGHRPHDTFSASDYGFSFVGENIWAWSDDSQPVPEKPMEDWFNEKNYYDFNSKHCSKEPCGHYTALVWSSTREVGCGFTVCPHTTGWVNYNNGVFFVCNYGPGGNDGNHPYKKGSPCSECSTGKMFCTDTLCDDSCSSAGSGGQCECKANCNNGEQTPSCGCKCKGEYTGVACNEVCADLSPSCGANPGLPEMLCGDPNSSPFGPMMAEQANSNCPKMCKKCGASKKRAEGVKDEILQAVDGILAEHDIHK
jgi:hypothetical protein